MLMISSVLVVPHLSSPQLYANTHPAPSPLAPDSSARLPELQKQLNCQMNHN